MKRRSGTARKEVSNPSSQYYLEMVKIQHKNIMLYKTHLDIKWDLLDKKDKRKAEELGETV